MEVEEENYSEKSEASSRVSSNTLTVRHGESSIHFKYDSKTINRLNERRDSGLAYRIEQRNAEEDSLLAFCPIEVYERNFLRNLQQQKEQETTSVSNSLQIPVLSVPNLMEKAPPQVENVYVSESMTIIDTDLPVS